MNSDGSELRSDSLVANLALNYGLTFLNCHRLAAAQSVEIKNDKTSSFTTKKKSYRNP